MVQLAGIRMLMDRQHMLIPVSVSSAGSTAEKTDP